MTSFNILFFLPVWLTVLYLCSLKIRTGARAIVALIIQGVGIGVGTAYIAGIKNSKLISKISFGDTKSIVSLSHTTIPLYCHFSSGVIGDVYSLQEKNWV